MSTGASTKRSSLKFFILVFALATPFWMIGAFTESLKGLPMHLPASALMFPCPFMAAAILIGREDGPAGVSRLLKRTLDHRGIRPKIWFLPICLLVPATMLVSYGLTTVTGLSRSGEHTPVLAAPVLFIVFFISAAGEELGWMGYAVTLMQGRWNALMASLILGMVWGAWHVLPLFQAHRSPTWITWWFLGTIATRVLIVWIYANTQHNILATIVFHDTLNVVPSMLPHYVTHDAIVAFFGVISALTAVVVALLWGPKTMSRYENPFHARHRPRTGR